MIGRLKHLAVLKDRGCAMNELDVAKWHYFKKGGIYPKPLQLCWVRLFETHGETILEESYHLALNIHVHREEWFRHQDDWSKRTKTLDRKYYEFIDIDGHLLGDGSGTELYQWKPCVSAFQQWNDATKWKAIKKFNDMQEEFNDPNGQFHIERSRCISQIKLKGGVLNAND